MLQLYPELQGSQEFHPWKSSPFSLCRSLSGKFCKHSSTQLLFTHASTFTQSYIRRQTQYSPEFCPLFSSPPKTPSHPHVAPEWASPNSEFNLPLSWQTKPSQQHRGGWGHCIEEVASPGMHGSRHDQTCSV